MPRFSDDDFFDDDDNGGVFIDRDEDTFTVLDNDFEEEERDD